MKLLAKLNLIVVLVFAVAMVPAALISRGLLEHNAQAQVIQNARIMMETALAMRGYTVSQVKPLLAPAMRDTFLSQSVPAFAATEIFNTLRKDHPEYTYKEATLNPTNPRNRAVDWEADLVGEFRRDPAREEIVGHRDTPLGPAFDQAAQHAFQSHAGINHNRNDARLEQAEDQGKKIKAGPDHKNGARAAPDADCFKTGGNPVRIGVQLGKSEVGIGHPAGSVPAYRRDNGFFIRKSGRHLFQAHRDINGRGML